MDRDPLEVRLMVSVKGLNVWVTKSGKKSRRTNKLPAGRNWVDRGSSYLKCGKRLEEETACRYTV